MGTVFSNFDPLCLCFGEGISSTRNRLSQCFEPLNKHWTRPKLLHLCICTEKVIVQVTTWQPGAR